MDRFVKGDFLSQLKAETCSGLIKRKRNIFFYVSVQVSARKGRVEGI